MIGLFFAPEDYSFVRFLVRIQRRIHFVVFMCFVVLVQFSGMRGIIHTFGWNQTPDQYGRVNLIVSYLLVFLIAIDFCKFGHTVPSLQNTLKMQELKQESGTIVQELDLDEQRARQPPKKEKKVRIENPLQTKKQTKNKNLKSGGGAYDLFGGPSERDQINSTKRLLSKFSLDDLDSDPKNGPKSDLQAAAANQKSKNTPNNSINQRVDKLYQKTEKNSKIDSNEIRQLQLQPITNRGLFETLILSTISPKAQILQSLSCLLFNWLFLLRVAAINTVILGLPYSPLIQLGMILAIELSYSGLNLRNYLKFGLFLKSKLALICVFIQSILMILFMILSLVVCLKQSDGEGGSTDLGKWVPNFYQYSLVVIIFLMILVEVLLSLSVYVLRVWRFVIESCFGGQQKPKTQIHQKGQKELSEQNREDRGHKSDPRGRNELRKHIERVEFNRMSFPYPPQKSPAESGENANEEDGEGIEEIDLSIGDQEYKIDDENDDLRLKFSGDGSIGKKQSLGDIDEEQPNGAKSESPGSKFASKRSKKVEKGPRSISPQTKKKRFKFGARGRKIASLSNLGYSLSPRTQQKDGKKKSSPPLQIRSLVSKIHQNNTI